MSYLSGACLVDAGIAKRQAADYLKKLDEIGILNVQKVGKENLYLNTKLYEILSKYRVDADDVKK
jgi:Cdc6-like AAA superfamily ATPase